jgi:hypothetical protein
MFDKVAVACEWTNARQLNMAYASLKGKADKWLESEDIEDWTWDILSARLTERFSRLRFKLNVRREFETRKQLKNETARTFLVDSATWPPSCPRMSQMTPCSTDLSKFEHTTPAEGTPTHAANFEGSTGGG